MSTTLATLRADNVDIKSETLGHVLGMTDHVHVEDAIRVEFIDDGLGGNTDGGDKELGAGADDDVDELAELALCVIVAVSCVSASHTFALACLAHVR